VLILPIAIAKAAVVIVDVLDMVHAFHMLFPIRFETVMSQAFRIRIRIECPP
jgi:hypothetical protein